MATIPVKYFDSTMSVAGGPTLSGSPGSLIALLDACLINGFNTQTLTSLSITSNVLNGAKTAHGFIVNQVITTAGAGQAQLNGDWRVTSVTADTFTCDATGVGDVTGTGTITAKTSALGWEKQWPGTNLAAYRSLDMTSTRCVLRVDDTGTTNARLVGYETMSDVNTGVGQYPTGVPATSAYYWVKSGTADAVARGWVLVGDGSTFYFWRNYYTSFYLLDMFGDFTSEKAGDAYRNMLTGAKLSTTTSTGYGLGMISWSTSGQTGIQCPRSYSQVGTAIELVTGFLSPASGSSGVSSTYIYPSPVSNGLILAPIMLKESGTSLIRCLAMPGCYATPLSLPLTSRDVVANIAGLPNRKVMAFQQQVNGVDGRLFVDITGPWK